MSTSHPIVKSVNSPQEINELFDHVESSAATAVLRMADYFTERTTLTKFVTIKILVVRHRIKLEPIVSVEFLF